MSVRAFIIGFCLLWFLLYYTDSPAGPYVEAGAGYNANLTGCSNCWEDADAGPFGAYLRLGYEWSGNEHFVYGVHWAHLSQWFKGVPFTDEDESSVDHIGAYIRYNF